MVNIIFLGAPGSGKGTQSALLSNDLKVPSISTGEILRKEVSESTEIGVVAEKYMKSGDLVPDYLIIDIIKKRASLKDCKGGFILDGFPRNILQAKMLEDMMLSLQKNIDLVIDIKVDESILIKRISGRFACKKCGAVYNHFFSKTVLEGSCDKCFGGIFESRSDDNEESVKNRLKIYHQNSFDLVNFYKKKDLIYSADGSMDIGLLCVEIKKAVNSLLNN